MQLRSLFQQPFNAAAAATPPQPPGAAAAAGSSSSGAAAAAAAAAVVACPLPPDAVVAVVAYNAYGEQRPDPVLTRMRAAAQQGGLGQGEGEGAVGQGAEAAAVEAEAAVGGCVGLWPAFSLINHSCAPVASYGLVRAHREGGRVGWFGCTHERGGGDVAVTCPCGGGARCRAASTGGCVCA